jgi:hypothetical protein
MYPSSRLIHALELLGGGSSDPKKLFTYLPTVVSKSAEDIERGRKEIAKSVSFYINSMGEYYVKNLLRSGFENEVRHILEAKGDQSSIIDGEKLLSDLSLIGSPKVVTETISEFPKNVIPVLGFGSKSKEEVHSAIDSMSLLSSEMG